MSDKIRIGVIGCGQIGNIHLTRYKDVPGVEIVAVCDVDEATARRAAEAHGAGQVYTDFRQLIARDDIQAVDVALHNNFHAPVSIAAMEAGKDVYCEKPIAGSYADGRRMLDAAAKTGKKLSMQLSSLFSKETRAARRIIDAGELGRIYYAKSSYYRRRGRCFVDGYGTPAFVQCRTAGGGALFDMGVYHIAQVLYLLGNPAVETISGTVCQEIDMYAHRREEGKFDVEEFAAGLVRLAGGVTLFIEEAWAVNLGGTDGSKLAGSRGGLSLSPFAFHRTVADIEMNATADLDAAIFRWEKCFPDQGAYSSSQHHWAAALAGKVELIPTAEIGLNTMLISEGLYLSSRLGREVKPDEVIAQSRSTAIKL